MICRLPRQAFDRLSLVPPPRSPPPPLLGIPSLCFFTMGLGLRCLVGSAEWDCLDLQSEPQTCVGCRVAGLQPTQDEGGNAGAGPCHLHSPCSDRVCQPFHVPSHGLAHAGGWCELQKGLQHWVLGGPQPQGSWMEARPRSLRVSAGAWLGHLLCPLHLDAWPDWVLLVSCWAQCL